MKIDSRDGIGPAIVEIPDGRFRSFAKRHATSPEIGPIKTYLDHDSGPVAGAESHVYGLEGCGKLCAAACLLIYQSKQGDSVHALKLDSVIVDPALRRRGLAGFLIAKLFVRLLSRADLDIKQIYAHSVHPATASLLRRLSFQEPLPTGAPISYLRIEHGNRANYISKFEGLERARMADMRLQCELCRKKHRNARPWCLPRGS